MAGRPAGASSQRPDPRTFPWLRRISVHERDSSKLGQAVRDHGVNRRRAEAHARCRVAIRAATLAGLLTGQGASSVVRSCPTRPFTEDGGAASLPSVSGSRKAIASQASTLSRPCAMPPSFRRRFEPRGYRVLSRVRSAPDDRSKRRSTLRFQPSMGGLVEHAVLLNLSPHPCIPVSRDNTGKFPFYAALPTL